MGGGVDADVADAGSREPEGGRVQSEEAGAFEVVRDEGEGVGVGGWRGRGGERVKEEEGEEEVLQGVGGEWVGFDSGPGGGLGGEGAEGAGEVLERFFFSSFQKRAQGGLCGEKIFGLKVEGEK